MKVCVHVRDPAPVNLKLDNLRSEGRWERQAFEACMENPEITDLYTSGYVWPGTHPKYRGLIDNNTSNGTILLMQDWNKSVFENRNYKAAFINVFAGPWLEQIPEIKAMLSALNNNLFFTMGFPLIYRDEFVDASRLYHGMKIEPCPETISHTEKFLPRKNVLLLPVPAAPYTTEGNNFDKNNLLWVSRLVFVSQMGQSIPLLWSLKKLQENSDLHLDVLTGWFANEVKEHIGNGEVEYLPDITKAFWELDAFKPFADIKDRVTIHLNLNWEEVLQKYNNAKLLTMHGRLFGGPPIEAGMHGVPFVGYAKTTGALADSPDYLYTTSDEEVCIILNKLFTDKDFYIKTGNAYRDYVKEHYTYTAFNRNLNKILKDRDLL